MKVLLAEDDVKLGQTTRELLIYENCTVDWAKTGTEAVEMVEDSFESSYDVVILDWMLPEMSGIEICRLLRRKYHFQGGIVFVTAKGEVDDCVSALDAGADDFIVKPFKIKELVARIHAVSRRQGKPFVDKIYRRGDVEINRDLHTVCHCGQTLYLRKKEFALFEVLFVNINRILPRMAIFEKVWSDNPDTNMESLDAHVYMLRKTLKALPQVKIKLVKNIGYKMEIES